MERLVEEVCLLQIYIDHPRNMLFFPPGLIYSFIHKYG